MRKVILDTNVLISFLTDRNLTQQKQAAGIFAAAADGSISILCQQEVISEFVYVMDSVYRVEKSEISGMLKEFSEMPGIEIVSDLDLAQVMKFWPTHITDYGDAVLAALCRKTRNAVVATFDKKFIKELKAAGLTIFS